MDRSLRALCVLNFFMADVRDGLGPFLGVFLQQQNWTPSQIGIVMTIGGLFAMLATTPAGALVDKTTAKRAVMVVSRRCHHRCVVRDLLHPVVRRHRVGPGGERHCRVRSFPRHRGHHARHGQAGGICRANSDATKPSTTPAISPRHCSAGIFGYLFGLGAVFVVMSVMAVASIAATAQIDPARIDHRAARGLAEEPASPGTADSRCCVTSLPLIVLGVDRVADFHLGNAAMLPLLGQALVARGARRSERVHQRDRQ